MKIQRALIALTVVNLGLEATPPRRGRLRRGSTVTARSAYSSGAARAVAETTGSSVS
jgi:hypothetical protein